MINWVPRVSLHSPSFNDKLTDCTIESTHLSDKPYDFWTFDVMISQLVCLIRHFGVEDDFNLLGHSWGGQLSLEYILNHPDKPRGLKHFVIVGSFPSMALYGRSSEALISKFPDWVKEGMEKGYDDPNAFRKACDVFLAVHGCRLKPMPEEFVRAFDEAFIDPAPHLGL
jgi:pimeloyl-ACP methyl ester carboxylesterase